MFKYNNLVITTCRPISRVVGQNYMWRLFIDLKQCSSTSLGCRIRQSYLDHLHYNHRRTTCSIVNCVFYWNTVNIRTSVVTHWVLKISNRCMSLCTVLTCHETVTQSQSLTHHWVTDWVSISWMIWSVSSCVSVCCLLCWLWQCHWSLIFTGIFIFMFVLCFLGGTQIIFW